MIAAIVLWVILGGVGQRTGAYYTDMQKLAESGGNESRRCSRACAPPTGVAAPLRDGRVFVLILLDMIFKPGA